MGVENLPDRTPGQTIQFSWINRIREILVGVFAPRGLNGNPRANYSRLGTESYRWKNFHAKHGYLGVGDVYHFHHYAGNIEIPQGWMIMDGTIVNEANYDAQHATGDWDEYIVSSPLSGVYLPDMDQVYIKGKSGTLQAGTSPITLVGANSADMSHDHGSPRTSSTPIEGASIVNDLALGWMAVNGHTHSVTIPTGLSTEENIRPSSTYVVSIMRII